VYPGRSKLNEKCAYITFHIILLAGNLGGAASLLASGNAYSMQGKVEVPGDTSDCMLTELPFAVQFGADRRQLGRVCHGQSHLYPYTRDSR